MSGADFFLGMLFGSAMCSKKKEPEPPAPTPSYPIDAASVLSVERNNQVGFTKITAEVFDVDGYSHRVYFCFTLELQSKIQVVVRSGAVCCTDSEGRTIMSQRLTTFRKPIEPGYFAKLKERLHGKDRPRHPSPPPDCF